MFNFTAENKQNEHHGNTRFKAPQRGDDTYRIGDSDEMVVMDSGGETQMSEAICNFFVKKLHIYKIIRTFAAEMVMHGCFTRARKGNQVRVLSSTRYCHPHYEKSIKATESSGRQTF